MTVDEADELGPEIRTTKLGKRLFEQRLAEMRKLKPDLKEPRWIITDEDKPEPGDNRTRV